MTFVSFKTNNFNSLNLHSLIGLYVCIFEKINNRITKSPILNVVMNTVQSAAAGYILQTLLGPGQLGAVVLGASIAAPLCCKGISMLTHKKGLIAQPKIHQVANGFDHV